MCGVNIDRKILSLKLATMFEELKQRALKITEALYRTTELFSDAEPLKWSLRKASLEILDVVSSADVAKAESLTKSLLLKLELASSGTFISKVNFEVLEREYLALLDKLLSHRENYQSLLDPPIAIAMRRASSNGLSDKAEAVSIKPGGRHEKLLSALQQKGPSSAGELAAIFEGSISEKTVQRELGSLVASGAVKQEGDKRWRRYFV
mgnify:FL=1